MLKILVLLGNGTDLLSLACRSEARIRMKTARILIILMLGTASSLCAAQIKTTTSISSSMTTSTYGQAVTFTAVVSPAPPNEETVEFLRGKNLLGTGTLSGGTATFTTTTLAKGTDNIKAEIHRRRDLRKQYVDRGDPDG